MQRLAAIVISVGLALSAPAGATALGFSGSFDSSNPPAAPGGRCSGLTVNIGNAPPFYATGASNFGAFTSTQSHCLDGPPPVGIGAPNRPYYDGLFTYTFASGATLLGTYTGLLTNSGVMGIIDNVQNFIVTGGSGRFTGATGSFLGTGEIRLLGGPPVATLTISDGVINTAVPEPAGWTMLIAGLGATGAAMRRRTRSAGVSGLSG